MTKRKYKQRKPRGHSEHYWRMSKDMYDDFQMLSERKMNGVKMLTTAAIMRKLEMDYYLTEQTIYLRIKEYARKKDSEANQLSLPV